MRVSSQFFISLSLTNFLLGYANVGYALTPTHTENLNYHTKSTISFLKEPVVNNQSNFYIGLLYVQPYSDNLKYATFVSGTQPYFQSWHYLAIKPDHHPAFELGFNYAIPNTPYFLAANWTHLNSNDSSSKQASTNTDLTTVEFVGPPYEMSPPVFGIKRVNSKVNFDFDDIYLHVAKAVDYDSSLRVKFFGGLNILRLNQTVTTTFSDYAGSPATPYSYPLPPDPSFSFKTENVSEYLGAGPDLGLSVQYKMESGFGILGEFLGLLTVGTIKAQDNFTSTSARLTSLGIGTSHQRITAPNATQVVFGADSRLGIFYNIQGRTFCNTTIEAGYRMATYLNAISTVSPNTLVQPGTVIVTPEFATGTMAIVSTDARSRPFSFSGFFLNLKVAIA